MLKPGAAAAPRPTVDDAVALLRAKASPRLRDGLGRYGIVVPTALGVSMADVQTIGKQLGVDHALAAALWRTGIYEARMLCAFVEDPARLTAAQLDRWCGDFDSWAVCDTLCFKLFDRSPLAWAAVTRWSKARGEQQKRAAFALLASLAGHDRAAPDTSFLDGLALCEQHATDDRHYVAKGVSWAIRRIGLRKSPVLRREARAVAARLAGSDDATARRTGKEALRDFRPKAARSS